MDSQYGTTGFDLKSTIDTVLDNGKFSNGIWSEVSDISARKFSVKPLGCNMFFMPSNRVSLSSSILVRPIPAFDRFGPRRISKVSRIDNATHRSTRNSASGFRLRFVCYIARRSAAFDLDIVSVVLYVLPERQEVVGRQRPLLGGAPELSCRFLSLLTGFFLKSKRTCCPNRPNVVGKKITLCTRKHVS